MTGLSDLNDECWYVYGLRLTGTDKCRYVGITTTTLTKRMYSHNHASRGDNIRRPVLHWIKKHYGNVEIYEIEKVPKGDRSLLADREIFWIGQLNSDSNLLNVDSGGFGVHDRSGPLHPLWGVGHTDASKKKMSASRKTWQYSDEYKKIKSINSMGPKIISMVNLIQKRLESE